MPPILPRVAQPGRKTFDPWNSSSTGHQRAENRLSGSTSWHESRSTKLAQQFADVDQGGGKARLYDTVGAGSLNFGLDGRKENGDWEEGAPGLRERGWQDIRTMLQSQGAKHTQDMEIVARNTLQKPIKAANPASKLLFRGLTIYVNGSSMPLVSDHKLKHLLVQHGASISIVLGRRNVTHVIVGRPSVPRSLSHRITKATTQCIQGSGGGLSAAKLQKEMTRVRGCGIKFVGAEWVLDSLAAGHRLPEWKYDGGVSTAPFGVKSIASKLQQNSG